MVTIMYFSLMATLMVLSSTVEGFSMDGNKILARKPLAFNHHRPLQQQEQSKTRLGAFAVDGAFSALDSFFQTEPYLAAFLTCSAKASAADWVAQSRQQEQNVPRNLAFILYGGLYQGCVQTFIYSVLFPAWFPDPSAQTILTQVAIDLFILGPLVCMPTVYTMKALFAGEEGLTGIQKYLDHVQHKGILFKYWSIWGPVQALNFGIVPTHLRVVFVAMFSFFWICLLSTVSSSDNEEQQESSTSKMVEAPSLTDFNNHCEHQQQYNSLPQAAPVRILSDAFVAAQVRQQHDVATDARLARFTSS